MHTKSFFVFLLFLFVSPIYGSWTPVVNNFEVKDYQAGAQNWGIAVQKNGWIYIANNYGLLEYDGCQWRLFGLSNSTAVRCVTIDDSGRIYAGGRNQYGFFTSNRMGELAYTSLSDSLPRTYKDFGEVWRIISHQGNLFVQTRQLLICHIDGQIQVIDPGAVIEAIAMVNGSLYIATNRDIYMLVGKRLHTLHGSDLLQNAMVSQMIEMDGNLLIATDCNGLFIYNGETIHPFHTDADVALRRYQIYAMANYDNLLIIGTVQQGVIVLSKQGKYISQITRDEGLQNNTVLSLSVEGYNLWVGLDRGISKIPISQNILFLHDASTDYGSGYAYCNHHGVNYWGTNHGLYYQTTPSSSLKFVDGSQGQVWSLDLVGDQLFCSHNKGLYRVSNGRLQPLLNEGCWHVKAIDAKQAIVGTYNGFYHLSHQSGKWFIKRLSGFSGTALYYSYSGELNAVLVKGSDSILCFDLNLEHSQLVAHTINSSDYRVSEDGEIIPASTSSAHSFAWSYLAEQHLLIDGFYKSYLTRDSFIIVGGLDGFYRFDARALTNPEQQLYFRRVTITSPYRQLIYGEGTMPASSNVTLDPGTYTLNVTLSGNNTSIVSPRFATRLWPVEKEYSTFSSSCSHLFAGMQPGRYRLDVKMLDGLTGDTWSRSLAISIKYPFYRQWWALCLYGLLLAALIYYAVYRVRQFAREKAERIQREKDQELQKQQLQILQLEKNQTQNKLKSKSQELSHMLLTEANRKEWSQNVLGDLRRITDLLNTENFAEAKTRTQALQSKLIRNTESGLDWKRFEINFDLVHEQFIAHLKEHYPWMSKQERQLCIYIKMGLLTKEIAPLMNISVRGVEMLRYRMRQKMGLPESGNIKKWLDEIK